MISLSSPRLRVALVLIALAVVCIAGGLFVGYAIGRKAERQRNVTTTWNAEVMESLRHKLRPSGEQQQAFQAAVDRAVSAMQGTRAQAVRETDAIIEALIADVRKELTPAQQPIFEQLVKTRGKTSIDMLKVEPTKAKK
jgi:hypothetical protein